MLEPFTQKEWLEKISHVPNTLFVPGQLGVTCVKLVPPALLDRPANNSKPTGHLIRLSKTY